MKLTSLLAVFVGLEFDLVISSPIPSDLAANPVHALFKRGAHLAWDPATGPENRSRKRKFWEPKCEEALTKEGCLAGIIHAGQSRMLLSTGTVKNYINVEGLSPANIKNTKRLRVFDDGTSTEGWSTRDLKTMAEAKRLNQAPGSAEAKKALLFWDPADAYQHPGQDRRQRRLYWEKRCDEALSKLKEGCVAGFIHKGETRSQRPDGTRTSYVRVDAAPLVDSDESRKFRVYEDGSIEDLTKEGWTEKDKKAMYEARFPRTRIQRSRKLPLEETQSIQGVSWDTANPYNNFPHMRLAYERACALAIARQGCDFGIIHQGQTREKKPDGTTRFHMIVTAGMHKDPGNNRYMRLYEDGSSEWYPPGLLPKQPRKRASRPRRRSRKQDRTGTQAQGTDERPTKRPKFGEASTSTQAEYLERLLAPSGDEHSPTQARRLFSEPDSGLLEGPSGGEYQHSPTYSELFQHHHLPTGAHTMHQEPFSELFPESSGSPHQHSPSQANSMFPEPDSGLLEAHGIDQLHHSQTQEHTRFPEPDLGLFDAQSGVQLHHSPTHSYSGLLRASSGGQHQHSSIQAHSMFPEPHSGLFETHGGTELRLSPTHPFSELFPTSGGGQKQHSLTQAHQLYPDPDSGLFQGPSGGEQQHSPTYSELFRALSGGEHPQSPTRDMAHTQEA